MRGAIHPTAPNRGCCFIVTLDAGEASPESNEPSSRASQRTIKIRSNCKAEREINKLSEMLRHTLSDQSDTDLPPAKFPIMTNTL
uniref:Uncharacterized protein n=1 Tax=Candidatus Kentrum sp. LPFa TaxID=2126335 RepID=A0A450WMW4_9GAMM|nr:MAG: hypothetical protein BECKLPF1236B_GA0070989_113912 [Candidatus Kentron sp. LPFa]